MEGRRKRMVPEEVVAVVFVAVDGICSQEEGEEGDEGRSGSHGGSEVRRMPLPFSCKHWAASWVLFGTAPSRASSPASEGALPNGEVKMASLPKPSGAPENPLRQAYRWSRSPNNRLG